MNAGIPTVLLESGYGTARLEEEVTPDYIMNDLRGVINMLRREKMAQGEKSDNTSRCVNFYQFLSILMPVFISFLHIGFTKVICK